MHCNQDVVLLPPATRTLVTYSSDQDNPYWRGCLIYLNITQINGTGGLGLFLQVKDPVSGNYVSLWYDYPQITAVGLYTYTFYPCPNLMSGTHAAAPVALPRTWRIMLNPQNSNQITYSVGCSMII